MCSFAALVAAALASLNGCGEDHPAAAVDTSPRPVPGCEGIDHTPCDVRDPSCQARLFALATCLRGDQMGPLPPITVVTEADLAAMLVAESAMDTPDPHVTQWDWALSALRLIQPGGLSTQTMISETVKFVWGLYRRRTKDILIIDHGPAFDQQSASPVLIHEMVHALQDREVDLSHFSSVFMTSHDSSLAATAIIEGEAQMHEARYGASILGLDPADVDWMRRFESGVALDQAFLLKQASPFTASARAFPYEWGARYVYYSWMAGGMNGVHARFLSPPVTTRLLMASMDQALEPEPAPDTLPAPSPPTDWQTADGTTLGAWALFLLLAENSPLFPQEAQSLALHWRGDGFWIYQGPAAGSAALVWRIELGDEQTAGRVVTIAVNLGFANARQIGTSAVLAMATDAHPLEWAFVP
jgi:hypothetical protein